MDSGSRRSRGSAGMTEKHSLRLDLGVANDLAPFLLFRFQVLGQLLRRAHDGCEVLPVEEALAEFRIGEGATDLAIDLRDDVARRSRRREQSEPGLGLVAGQPAL